MIVDTAFLLQANCDVCFLAATPKEKRTPLLHLVVMVTLHSKLAGFGLKSRSFDNAAETANQYQKTTIERMRLPWLQSPAVYLTRVGKNSRTM